MSPSVSEPSCEAKHEEIGRKLSPSTLTCWNRCLQLKKSRRRGSNKIKSISHHMPNTSHLGDKCQEHQLGTILTTSLRESPWHQETCMSRMFFICFNDRRKIFGGENSKCNYFASGKAACISIPPGNKLLNICQGVNSNCRSKELRQAPVQLN